MKRYAIMTYNGVSKMCEAPDGQYVKYEDVKPNDNLRDEFAGRALATLVESWADSSPKHADECAKIAYRFADAMLEARNARAT